MATTRSLEYVAHAGGYTLYCSVISVGDGAAMLYAVFCESASGPRQMTRWVPGRFDAMGELRKHHAYNPHQGRGRMLQASSLPRRAELIQLTDLVDWHAGLDDEDDPDTLDNDDYWDRAVRG